MLGLSKVAFVKAGNKGVHEVQTMGCIASKKRGLGSSLGSNGGYFVSLNKGRYQAALSDLYFFLERGQRRGRFGIPQSKEPAQC